MPTGFAISTGDCVELIERYRGALLGLAVGDALGTTLEFKRFDHAPGSGAPLLCPKSKGDH